MSRALKTKACILSLLWGWGLAILPATADILVTNGDFELPGTNLSANGFAQGITGWGERNNNAGFPAFSDFLIIGSPHGAYLNGQTAGISNHVVDNGYLYQEIGTANGWPRVQVTGLNFWRNDSSLQHGPLTVAMYWLPSTSGFSFSEVGNDIAGTGNLIANYVVADPAMQNGIVPFSLSFDVSTLANNARLFLRFDASATQFAYLDNIGAQVVPEPSVASGLAVALLCLLRKRGHSTFRTTSAA